MIINNKTFFFFRWPEGSSDQTIPFVLFDGDKMPENVILDMNRIIFFLSELKKSFFSRLMIWICEH